MFQIDNNLLINQEYCPICSNKSKIIDTIKTMNEEFSEKVSLCECLVCKHWWINPLPKQELLSSWYANRSNFVINSAYKGTSPDDASAEKIFLKLTDYLKTPNFNYLEIGCGTGNLLKHFSKKANITYGVGPGSWNTDPSLKIIKDIDLIPKGMTFDIIVLGDVLEHLSDPNAMIEKICLVANKNAIIYLEFPNKDSFKARGMKSGWSMIRPFGHLHFFSSKSITELCKQNNLRILTKKSKRAGNITTFDLIKSFNFSEPNILYRLIKSLLLGQIIFGKDQWDIILTK